MEDSTKCEDIDYSNTNSVYSQVNQICLDTKSLVDNKNTQIRVVRGTKKLKIDNSDPVSNDKKGMFSKLYNKNINQYVILNLK